MGWPRLRLLTEAGMANKDETQTVIGHVKDTPDGQVVEVEPFFFKGDVHTKVNIEFDRPVSLSLSDLFSDPAVRAEVESGIEAIFNLESSRIDDLLRAGNLDPATDLAGSDMAGADFVGTPDRPLDIRGWNLSEAVLDGCRFENVLVDETTILTGASANDISGDASADLVAELVQAANPALRP